MHILFLTKCITSYEIDQLLNCSTSQLSLICHNSLITITESLFIARKLLPWLELILLLDLSELYLALQCMCLA